MPQGVEVLVEDGYATVEFVDPTKRGEGLNALLAAGGPEAVQKVTRPRPGYIVPEDVARTAGLLDGDVDSAESADESGEPEFPEGEPEQSWKRAELDAYAKATHGLDTTDLGSKADVLDAISEAAAQAAPTS